MSAEWALLVVIIAGIVMVALAVLYNVLFDIGKTEFSKRECQLSLQLTQKVEGWTPGAFCVQPVGNPVPLKCSRRFLEVSDDDVLKEGESIKYEYNPRCDGSAVQIGDSEVRGGGQCLAQNVLAKEMGRCWNTFFAGEYPVFQQVEEGLMDLFSDDQRACFVCAEVTLDTQRNVTDFVSYMKEKEYILGESYYAYIAENDRAICNPAVRDRRGTDGNTCWDVIGQGTEGFWKDLIGVSMPPIEQDTFVAGQKYAVTFMRLGMTQQEKCSDDPRHIPTMTVQVLPADDIGKYCNQVMA